MLERPRLAVNVEHVSEVRLEPASTGLGLATVHQNEERPPSPTVSDRATIGDPSTSLKQPSLGVVIAPTSPISFNFSHHDPNFACDRHLRRARLIATTPSVLVLGSLLWVGVEAVVSVIRLGTTAGVESVGGRKVVLWVEIGVVTLGVLVVVADIFWILAVSVLSDIRGPLPHNVLHRHVAEPCCPRSCSVSLTSSSPSRSRSPSSSSSSWSHRPPCDDKLLHDADGASTSCGPPTAAERSAMASGL